MNSSTVGTAGILTASAAIALAWSLTEVTGDAAASGVAPNPAGGATGGFLTGGLAAAAASYPACASASNSSPPSLAGILVVAPGGVVPRSSCSLMYSLRVTGRLVTGSIYKDSSSTPKSLPVVGKMVASLRSP